jgi:hypothetical protein
MRALSFVLIAGCSTVVLASCSSGGTGGLSGGATGASASAGAGAGSGTGRGGAGGAAPTSSGTGGVSLSSSSAGTGGTTASGSSGGTSTSGSSGGTGGTAASTSSGSGGTASGSSGGTGGTAASTSSGSGGTASGSSGTTSSAGATASSSSGGPLTFIGACNGADTILNGTVFAPNGTDPIPNIRVYAAIQINPYPASYCDKCSAPIDPAYVSTKTAPDGTFSLNLDLIPESATIDFAIQIGRFRKHTILPVTACQTQTPPAAARTLPGSSAAGDIPNIAVSSGNVDHLDAVLAAVGITQYDCYEGRSSEPGTSTSTCQQKAGTNISQVIADAATLDTYHMAFLSCAPNAYSYFVGKYGNQAAMTQNTQSWVASGGRLFVTDTAYDYVAQAFPGPITFAGPPGVPQPIDGANIGCAPPGPGNSSAHTVQYNVTVDDPLLTEWLAVGVHVLPTPPPSPAVVSIEGFYQPWSAVSSLATGTQLIADGTMPLDATYATTMCKTPTMTDVPLTAEFDVPSCGRVIFSSYHTYQSGGNNAIAQQKIMEYLIFNAAFCNQ